MMNSGYAPKEIVQSFIDLVNMAKWLMDENQQSSVTQESGKLFSSIRGGGLHGLPQNGRLKKYADQKQHQRNHGSLCHLKQSQEKLPVNLLFFPVENLVIADLLLGSCHFLSLIFHIV